MIGGGRRGGGERMVVRTCIFEIVNFKNHKNMSLPFALNNENNIKICDARHFNENTKSVSQF